MEDLPRWYYDEFQQIGTDYESVEEVEKYDQRMGQFRDIKQEVDLIVNMSSLKEDDVVLEYGCGTGEFLIAAAAKCRMAYGLDISGVMLDYLQRKLTAAQVSHKVKLIHAGFLSYKHQGEPIDAAVSQLALHHLPDFWKHMALKKVYEILKPGGCFFLRDVVFPSPHDDYYSYFDNLIDKMRKDSGDEMAGSLVRHIKGEYSTCDWIMEGLLRSSGFSIEKNIRDGIAVIYLCRKTAFR